MRRICSAYNRTALDKINGTWRENLAWVKELPPELVKIAPVFIHKAYKEGKIDKPYRRAAKMIRKCAAECIPFRCIEHLLAAVKLLHNEAAAACISNDSKVLPMGAEDLFPIFVYVVDTVLCTTCVNSSANLTSVPCGWFVLLLQIRVHSLRCPGYILLDLLHVLLRDR